MALAVTAYLSRAVDALNNSLARASLRSLARYLCNAPIVDTDCGQDPARANTLAESQLARDAVCHVTGFDDVADSPWEPDI